MTPTRHFYVKRRISGEACGYVATTNRYGLHL
jgi:hypothetical protein